MINPLIEISLMEDGFTSHINLSPEEVKNQHLPHHTIPERYNIDRLVILPVNPNLIFSYWFTTDSLKEEINRRFSHFTVLLKLFEDGSQMAAVDVGSLEGSWYIHHHAPFKRITAVVGIMVDGKFYELLHSNEIVMPSDEIFVEEEQHWYNRKDNTVRIRKTDTQFIDQLNLIAREREKSGYTARPSSMFR